MATSDMTWTRWNTTWWEQQGTRGGIVAGAILILFEMVAAALTFGMTHAYLPFRLRSAIVLGPEALDAATPVGPAVVTGSLIHLTLASVFGSAFGAFIARRRRLTRSLAPLLGAGIVYGLVLWLINVYSVAPAIGWPWFPEETEPLTQALGHACFFGIPLALFLYWMAAPRRRLGIE